MAIYRPPNPRALAQISYESRLSNQIVFNGSSGNTISLPKGSVFLEFIQVESGGTVTIEDGKSITIVSGLTEFSNDHSPLRCDYGVTITGDLEIAKGFIQDGIFVS